mgnify:CR=1 FL=1
MIESEHVFTYGNLVQFEYQDRNSRSVILTVKITKGERKLFLSINKLIIYICEILELHKILVDADSLIVALQPFIVGEATFDDTDEASSEDIIATQCPKAVLQKKRTWHAKQRVQKKPVKKT